MPPFVISLLMVVDGGTPVISRSVDAGDVFFFDTRRSIHIFKRNSEALVVVSHVFDFQQRLGASRNLLMFWNADLYYMH